MSEPGYELESGEGGSGAAQCGSASDLSVPPCRGESLHGAAVELLVQTRSVGRRALIPGFSTAIAGVVAAGWMLREENLLRPEEGGGYWLGVAGAAGMLSLLSYAARKRLSFLQGCGRLAVWFRVHVVLGIVAPVAILFHANFGMGSTNSSVALVSMLIVMVSGIVGRFLYARVTRDLYARRATLREVTEELERHRERLGSVVGAGSVAMMRLARLEGSAVPGGRWWAQVKWLIALPFEAGRLRAAIRKELETSGREDERSMSRTTLRVVDAYVNAVLEEAHLAPFERLFSLWHALHVPLIALLFVTAVVHVIAVHVY